MTAAIVAGLGFHSTWAFILIPQGLHESQNMSFAFNGRNDMLEEKCKLRGIAQPLLTLFSKKLPIVVGSRTERVKSKNSMRTKHTISPPASNGSNVSRYNTCRVCRTGQA
ncbi:hypothetical protein IQ07DRAFT_281754 [Pyrenochaeta sp. DS3sAY3a]|nr:hypothetical protein IQ07DRAFT_281754 [Pyrenochaeta sp. DS3sAY3a]